MTNLLFENSTQKILPKLELEVVGLKVPQGILLNTPKKKSLKLLKI